MKEEKVFVVIPVYNEDPEVLLSVLSGISEFETVIVDDGSDIPILNQLQGVKFSDSVHFCWHPANKGQGIALKTGLDLALSLGATVLCTMDADGQHDPNSVRSIIAAFQTRPVDILFGSRFLSGDSKVPFLKKVFLKGGIFINYLYAGIWLHDAHCGLRAMNGAVAQKLKFYNGRQAHASEILWIVHKNRFRYGEHPVTIQYTRYSQSKGQSVWNSFNILFRLLRHRFYILTGSKRKKR